MQENTRHENTREINKRTAFTTGMLLIAAIVCGVLNSVPAIETSDYLEKLSDLETRLLMAGFFQAAMAIIYVTITVITYPIVKHRHSEGSTSKVDNYELGSCNLNLC